MADFDPAAYLSQKAQAQPAAPAFDPGKYLAEKTTPVPAEPSIGAKVVDAVGGAAKDAYMGAAGGTANGGEAFSPISEHIPLIGPLGKQLGQRFRAGVGYLYDAATGKSEPYAQELQDVRSKDDAREARFASEHPLADYAGKLIGGAGALAIPVPGAGMAGVGGAAARFGGAVTAAGTDALLRTEDPDKVKQAATIAGGLQAGLEMVPVVGRLARPLAEKASDAAEGASEAAQEFANERAVKAATGQNKRVVTQIAKTKGIQDTGEALLSGDDPVVQFGSSVSTIRDRAAKAADETWNQIEGIYQQADEAAGGKAINGKDIADAIRQRAAAIEPLPHNEGTIEALEKNAAYFEKKGPMTLSQAQDLKNNFVFKMTDPRTHVLGTNGNNAIRDAITEQMGEAIQKTDPVLAEAWRQGMDKYGAYAVTSGAASDRAVANLSNRFISPSDYAAGAAGAILEQGAKPDAGAAVHGIVGTAIAAGHKVLRERGSAMAAATANAAAKGLAAAPDFAATNAAELEGLSVPASVEAPSLVISSQPALAPAAAAQQDKKDAIHRRLRLGE